MEFIGKQISFSNPPGIAYEYSNLGFALLGRSLLMYLVYVTRIISKKISGSHWG
jgi:hypothetical protein